MFSVAKDKQGKLEQRDYTKPLSLDMKRALWKVTNDRLSWLITHKRDQPYFLTVLAFILRDMHPTRQEAVLRILQSHPCSVKQELGELSVFESALESQLEDGIIVWKKDKNELEIYERFLKLIREQRTNGKVIGTNDNGISHLFSLLPSHILKLSR